MSEVEVVIDMPAEYSSMVFGQFDEYAKAIESNLNIELIARDGVVKIIGAEANVIRARGVLDNLIELARRGNQISRQSVDYAISLSFDDKQDTMLEIDSDTVCRTIAGKPIKPKTLGQKNYVDQIRDKMIVFGIGPAGTGKTYLAMAMAIQAFKSNEVNKIILTRPAIEAGEKLGFLPGDLQSKVDPYLRPLYDALFHRPDGADHGSGRPAAERRVLPQCGQPPVGDCPARLPRQPYRRDQPGPALPRCRLPGADP